MHCSLIEPFKVGPPANELALVCCCAPNVFSTPVSSSKQHHARATGANMPLISTLRRAAATATLTALGGSLLPVHRFSTERSLLNKQEGFSSSPVYWDKIYVRIDGLGLSTQDQTQLFCVILRMNRVKQLSAKETHDILPKMRLEAYHHLASGFDPLTWPLKRCHLLLMFSRDLTGRRTGCRSGKHHTHEVCHRACGHRALGADWGYEERAAQLYEGFLLPWQNTFVAPPPLRGPIGWQVIGGCHKGGD